MDRDVRRRRQEFLKIKDGAEFLVSQDGAGGQALDFQRNASLTAGWGGWGSDQADFISLGASIHFEATSIRSRFGSVYFHSGRFAPVELESVPRLFSIFRLQRKSLVRGTALALASLGLSFRLSGFPDAHFSIWMVLVFLMACAATWDTARCLQKRWSFYHGGVLLLLYVDLMILLMISFLLLAPFSKWLL